MTAEPNRHDAPARSGGLHLGNRAAPDRLQLFVRQKPPGSRRNKTQQRADPARIDPGPPAKHRPVAAAHPMPPRIISKPARDCCCTSYCGHKRPRFIGRRGCIDIALLRRRAIRRRRSLRQTGSSPPHREHPASETADRSASAADSTSRTHPEPDLSTPLDPSAASFRIPPISHSWRLVLSSYLRLMCSHRNCRSRPFAGGNIGVLQHEHVGLAIARGGRNTDETARPRLGRGQSGP